MKLSPHDEERMAENVEDTRGRIEAREQARERARKRHQDYIDLQLEVMRRK
jgi:hypothetical protein